MERDLVALVFSLITLFICVYLFINFNYFKNTPNLKINEEILLSDNAKICRDTDNKFDCQPIMTQNNTMKLNKFKTNLYLSNNTVICKDVNKPETCLCLGNKNKCNHFRDIFISNDRPVLFYELINNKITFNLTNSLNYTGRVIPIIPTNDFSLSFWINIHKIDVTSPRILFEWKDYMRLSIMPYKSPCSSKLYLQLFNLLNIGGTYADSCINDMDYYKWCHFVIQGKGNYVEYYFNGQPSNNSTLTNDYGKGDVDKDIIIGMGCIGITISNMYYFNGMLNSDQINYLMLENPDGSI